MGSAEKDLSTEASRRAALDAVAESTRNPQAAPPAAAPAQRQVTDSERLSAEAARLQADLHRKQTLYEKARPGSSRDALGAAIPVLAGKLGAAQEAVRRAQAHEADKEQLALEADRAKAKTGEDLQKDNAAIEVLRGAGADIRRLVAPRSRRDNPGYRIGFGGEFEFSDPDLARAVKDEATKDVAAKRSIETAGVKGGAADQRRQDAEARRTATRMALSAEIATGYRRVLPPEQTEGLSDAFLSREGAAMAARAELARIKEPAARASYLRDVIAAHREQERRMYGTWKDLERGKADEAAVENAQSHWEDARERLDSLYQVQERDAPAGATAMPSEQTTNDAIARYRDSIKGDQAALADFDSMTSQQKAEVVRRLLGR